MSRQLTIMLVAGEASGDALGAGLAAALRRRLDGQVRFVGLGGERMAAEGVTSPFNFAELSVLGIVEGLRAWPRVVRRADEIAALAERERPDVAVLIDNWGFTLRVAQRLRRRLPSLPLIKYVGPQVWASRPGRARTLARTVDRLLSIHAMDAPYFEVEGLPVTFVGNPALALDLSAVDPERLRRAMGLGDDAPILLLLPGSRAGEVARLMPPFREAVERLTAARPGLRVAISVAPTVATQVRTAVAGWSGSVRLLATEEERHDGLKAATAALVCSGTATTELALAGTAMVVGYRLNAATHAVLKRLLRTRWVTLFNIAADAEIAPELIQDRCTGEALAAAAGRLLDDPALRAEQVRRQTAALDRMGRGGPDPSELAADAVLREVAERLATGPPLTR